MEFTQEAIEQEYRERSFNHPGFNHPLTHRRIRPSDTLALSQVIRKSHKHLKGYIAWAQYAGEWNFKQIQRFVSQHARDEFPRDQRAWTEQLGVFDAVRRHQDAKEDREDFLLE